MAGKDLARTSQTREPGPTIALVMMGVVAAAVIAVRCSSLMVGAGASSSTFWCRRWVEQSRSKKWRTAPWWSPITWTSMWRGR